MSDYFKSDEELDFLKKLYAKEMSECGYMDRGVLEDAILEWKNRQIQFLQSQLEKAEEVILMAKNLSHDKFFLLNLNDGQFGLMKSWFSAANEYFENKEWK